MNKLSELHTGIKIKKAWQFAVAREKKERMRKFGRFFINHHFSFLG